MFVNINPEPASAFESLYSLKFAAKVNGCETGAKGGAKRHTSSAGSAQIVPTMMAASASGSGGMGVEGKRFSLPGPPKGPGMAAPAAADPSAKRMSMYSGPGAAGGAAAGSKRPPTGIPPAGNPSKRVRQ